MYSCRSQLNKFYNGEGISKFFSTKDKLKIKEVYLTVFGLSQPLPYALFNGEAASMNDGLQDRFMLICAPPYLEEADVDEDQSQADPSVNEAGSSKPSAEQATRKIINEYVLALYKFHKNGIAYELSDDANSYLKDVSTAWNIGRKVAYQGAEDKFSEGNASFADMPDHDSGSKDIEYIVKYSAILHVFASSITDALDKNLESISIPTTIPRVMVERAHNLVSTMREHQLKFNKLLEDFNNSKAGPSKMGPIGEGTPVDENFVQRSILMYPGPVVSNAMLLRKCRQIHTKSSDVPKIMNNMTKKRGEAMYVGQYKRKGNKHIFYKAEPRFVDEKHLETLKISLADYSKTYKEVSGNPGLKVDWAKYYPSLLADKPIDMDTE